MRKWLIPGVAIAAALSIVVASAEFGQAQNEDGEVISLRGDVRMEEASPAPETAKQDITEYGFDRAYRQQPPLIPHKVDANQITKDANKCLNCHDWPAYVKEKAPKISETHYRDRTGNSLDTVGGARWFCTQCHVPQIKAKDLVENTFKNAKEVD